MSKVEQYLTMVNREIAIMSRDQLGSWSRTKFADRVIADVCGIESFASQVLASKNPKAVILNAIRSSRGECLMRLFSEKMHDARLELVDVLTEAVKTSDLVIGADPDTHNYLQKLYEKAVKKTRKLVGSKTNTKIQFNTKYPALSRITGSIDRRNFDYFSDEDDDNSDDSYDQYVDDYFEALTTGKELPKPIAYREKELDLDLDIDPDILHLIDNIQRRLGRRLSSAEIADIIRNVEEDDEDEVIPTSENIVGLDPKTQKLVDAVANVVVAKLISQGAAVTGESNKPDKSFTEPIGDFDPDEIHMKDDLEAFLDGSDSTKTEAKTVIPIPIRTEPKVVAGNDSVSKEAESEPITTEKLISVVNGVEKEEEIGEGESSSGIQPPVDEAGGNDHDEKPLAVNPVPSEDYQEFFDEKFIDRTVKNVLEEVGPRLNTDVETFLTSAGFGDSLVNLQINLTPTIASSVDKPDILFEFNVRVLINGDPSKFNMFHLTVIASRHLVTVAVRLNISPDLIELRLHMVSDSGEYRPGDLFYQTANLYSTDIDDLDSTICGIVLNVYHNTGVPCFASRILEPDTNLLELVIGIKKTRSEIDEKSITEAKDQICGYLKALPSTWETLGGNEYGISGKFLESEDDLREHLMSIFGSENERIFKMCCDKAIHSLYKRIHDSLLTDYGLDIAEKNLVGKPDFSEIGGGIAMDLYYTITFPKNSISVTQETEFLVAFSHYYEYECGIEEMLQFFSNSLYADAYYKMAEEDEEIDTSES